MQKQKPPDLSRLTIEERHVAHAPDVGTRLDRFLKSRFPWRSREHLQERIRCGDVLVNGHPAKASTSLRLKDEVTVVLERSGDPYDPATIPLPVLYEDEAIVALDKPAGYVVHPVGRHQMDTIVNALHLRYRRPDEPGRDVVPKLAHRLDQHTSGVLLVAKRDDVRADLGRQFAGREVEKEYLAIVRGAPAAAEGAIEAPIGRNPAEKNGLPMQVRDDGEPSLTLYRVEETFAEHSLVRCFPRSGRTHQIRVHLAWLGHPLIADRLYGDGAPLTDDDGEPLLAHYPLHAARLAFTHPATGRRMEIRAETPPHFEKAIRRLRAGR